MVKHSTWIIEPQTDRQTDELANRQNQSHMTFMENRTHKLKPGFTECVKADQRNKLQVYVLYWIYYVLRVHLYLGVQPTRISFSCQGVAVIPACSFLHFYL